MSERGLAWLNHKSNPAEEETDPSKNAPVKKRTKDQGIREKGVKHRTTDASRPEPGKDAGAKQSPSRSLEEIANIFNTGSGGIELISVPSSAGKTPTSIPVTFQGSASALPTEQSTSEVKERKREKSQTAHPSAF